MGKGERWWRSKIVEHRLVELGDLILLRGVRHGETVKVAAVPGEIDPRPVWHLNPLLLHSLPVHAGEEGVLFDLGNLRGPTDNATRAAQ